MVASLRIVRIYVKVALPFPLLFFLSFYCVYFSCCCRSSCSSCISSSAPLTPFPAPLLLLLPPLLPLVSLAPSSLASDPPLVSASPILFPECSRSNAPTLDIKYPKRNRLISPALVLSKTFPRKVKQGCIEYPRRSSVHLSSSLRLELSFRLSPLSPPISRDAQLNMRSD